jgi:hypothetical protein
MQFRLSRRGLFGSLLAATLVGSTVLPAVAGAQGATAQVRAWHASPDAPAVDVYVDGARAFANLAFGDVTQYADVPAGERRV